MKFRKVVKSVALSMLMILAGSTASAAWCGDDGGEFAATLNIGAQTINGLEPVYYLVEGDYVSTVLSSDSVQPFTRDAEWIGGGSLGYLWNGGIGVNVEAEYSPLKAGSGDDIFEAKHWGIYFNLDYHTLAGSEDGIGFFFSAGAGFYYLYDVVMSGIYSGIATAPDDVAGNKFTAGFFVGAINGSKYDEWLGALKFRFGMEGLFNDFVLFGGNVGLSFVQGANKLSGGATSVVTQWVAAQTGTVVTSAGGSIEYVVAPAGPVNLYQPTSTISIEPMTIGFAEVKATFLF